MLSIWNTFQRKEGPSVLSVRSSFHPVHLWPSGLSLPLQPQWPPSPPSTQTMESPSSPPRRPPASRLRVFPHRIPFINLCSPPLLFHAHFSWKLRFQVFRKFLSLPLAYRTGRCQCRGLPFPSALASHSRKLLMGGNKVLNCCAQKIGCVFAFMAPEKGMATHSSILAQRIPWTEEPGQLQSMGWQRVGHDWVTNTFIHLLLWH